MSNPIVELDVGSTEEVPEELYEFLLDQFVAKAREMGYDVIEEPIVLSNWKITCEIEPQEDE
jgi:hypothetical protein